MEGMIALGKQSERFVGCTFEEEDGEATAMSGGRGVADKGQT